MSSHPDPGRYRRLLETFYGFYHPMETAMPVYGADERQWIDRLDRRKSPLLRSDLKLLGLTSAEIDALPLCDALPEMTADSRGRLLGCMYVLEGSTLGGQHIVKRLASAWPHRFFASYTPNVADAWKRFCTLLADDHVAENASIDPDHVVSAARETFERFDAWAVRCGY